MTATLLPRLAMRASALLLALVLLQACKKGSAASDSANAVSQSGSAASGSEGDPAVPQTSLPVTTEDAMDGDLVISILTTGTVRSAAESRLRFEVAGVIDRVNVRPGQQVRRGDVLATLDSVPFVIALRRAELALDDARIRYQDLLVDSIVLGRSVSAERAQNARTRSGLAVAELNLRQARIDRQRASMVAPFDGVVDRVRGNEGERSDQSDASIVLVDMRNLWIEATVLEHDMPLIREGGDALVSSSVAPNQLARGRISNVLPLIDSTTRAGRAYVRLTSNGALRPGMSVDVRLEAQRLRARRLVPAKAVIMRDDRPLVFVVRDGRAYWQYIELGRTNGIHTEILPDSITGEHVVKVGEPVIVMGQLTLTHDAPVTVIKKEEIIR